MKKYILNEKMSTLSFIAILIISTILIGLPAVMAQDPGSKTTYALIGATPNPIGINQQLLIHLGITDRLATDDLGWHGLTVTVEKPDGSTETLGPFTTDSTGGTGTIYVPSMVGTYTLQTHFPEQENPAYVRGFLGPELPEGLVMEASISSELEVVVQSDPIDFYPGHPLPTEYWKRPIDAQLREWSSIAGNWLPGYNEVPPNLYVPYNDGPETPHILWAKPMQTGGLAGGETGNHAFECGDAYEGFYLGAVILGGNLYYNNYKSGFPTQDVVAVDLHTGQELWRHPLVDSEGNIVRLSFAQSFYWDSYNYHAVFPYLWATRGSTWHAFDPFEGEWVYSMQNVPSGTNLYGPKGEIFRYTVNLNNGWMTLWNSSRVVSDEGSWIRGGMGDIFDATDGIEWNITIPDDLPGSVRAVLDDRIVGAEITSTEVNSWAISIASGHEGALLFQNSWQAPAEWQAGKVFVDWAAISAEDNVFVLWAREPREYYAFSTETGSLLWGPTEPEHYLNIYKVTLEKYGESKIAYGKLISTAMAGIVYCYDVTNGNLEWAYEASDPYNEILWSNNWPAISLFITDGKVYIGHEEHSPIDPKPRGAPFYCLDVETGEEVFRVNGLIRQNHWGGRALIGDSIIATYNSYDQQIYAIGKGPSKTSVTIQNDVINQGSSAMVKGMVTDLSPGTKDPVIMARFPNGVPAVSDASINDWMLYVYTQFQRPTDTIGVPVKIEIIDPDGNYAWIGTATTDMDGNYAYSFIPQKTGKYMIIATFDGSTSYYGSHSITYLQVDPAPAQVSIPPYPGYQGPSAQEVANSVVANLPTDPTPEQISQAVVNAMPEYPEPQEVTIPEYTTIDILLIILVAIAIIIGLVSIMMFRRK
jgi:hypothetical protein